VLQTRYKVLQAATTCNQGQRRADPSFVPDLWDYGELAKGG